VVWKLKQSSHFLDPLLDWIDPQPYGPKTQIMNCKKKVLCGCRAITPATVGLCGCRTALCGHPRVLQTGCSEGVSNPQASRHYRESATAVQPVYGMPQIASACGLDRELQYLCP
jgi:hypothetical protein